MKTIKINKRILVIGSSRGIGYEISKYLLSINSKVIISSSNTNNLNKAFNNLTKFNKKFKSNLSKVKLDVSDFNKINYTCNKIKKKYSKLDVIVFGAAVLGPSGSLKDNSFDEWIDTFNTNIFGYVKIIKYFLKYDMIKSNSKLIFISGGISSSDPYFTSFSASKHALNGFAYSLSDQLKEKKIWINSILPGSYHTRMNEIRIERGPKEIGKSNYKIALSRIHQDNKKLYIKLFKLIEFLCSNKSDGITGRIISAQYDKWESNIKYLKKDNDLYKIIRSKIK